jgi:ankyrin repeat protein
MRFTDIIDAVNDGTIEDVRYFIEKGVDVNAERELNLLFIAAYKGKADVVELLLSNGANVNAKQYGAVDGLSPLHAAAMGGNIDVATILLSAGADINLKSDKNSTPLYEAIHNSKVEIAKFLILRGTDVNVEAYEGFTPLLAAIFRGLDEIVKLLISNGANVNTKCDDGTSPLYAAVGNANLNITKILISNGADVNAKTSSGLTPLHEAAFRANSEIAELLILNKADINAEDNEGIMPLHAAAGNGNIEVAKTLISHRANVNNKGRYSFTPLELAKEREKTEMVKYLISVGAKEVFKNIFDAAGKGYVEDVRYFIEQKGIDVNAKDNLFGWTPLLHAVSDKNIEVVKFLISKGAYLVPVMLVWSAGRGDELAKILVSAGADVNARDSGLAPFHSAALNGDIEFAKFIYSKGADVNVKDNDGKTPLDFAEEKGKTEMIEYLKSVGGKTGKTSDSGIKIGKILKFVAIGIGVLIVLQMCMNC